MSCGHSCNACGGQILRTQARCHHCGAERSHKECFPEQYSHPLVGKTVRVTVNGSTHTVDRVERVVQDTRWGTLVELEQGDIWFRLPDLEVVESGHDEKGEAHDASAGDP